MNAHEVARNGKLFLRYFLTAGIVAAFCMRLSAQQSPHGILKTKCQACHTTNSWKMRKDATFDHSATSFALTGQHRAVPCVSCHTGLKFGSTATKCASCHNDIHRAELGNDCSRCHTTRAWNIPDMRRLHQTTRFSLLGAHSSIPCTDCHKGEAGRQYRGLPTTCVGCHESEFRGSKNPNHVTAGFSSECTNCHLVSSTSWGGSFDHAKTNFPLTGAHISAQCIKCHTNNIFKGISSPCVPCHQQTYSATVNPNHTASGFPVLCQQCHSTSTWRPSTFDHSATSFSLTGAHRAVVCNDCHQNNQYANLPTACNSCHTDDFNNVTSPNHVSLQFPQDCAQCHSTTAWTPVLYNHSATLFPLTGKHVTTACANCHTNNNYQLAYSDCYQCHQTEFQRSTTLNHVASNLNHNCTSCHTTTAWLPSTFNHDAQYFRIYSGKHNGKWTQCASCHPNVSAYSQFTCFSCHEHNQTDTDNHHLEVSGYVYASPNCYACHRNV